MKAKKALLLWGCLWLSLACHAQQWFPFRTFPTEEPTAVSADAHGKIYLATSQGEVKCYSPKGTLLQTYSPQSASYFNSLEVRPGMQVWAFDENRQEMLFLDRFMNPVSSKQLPADVFGYATAVSSSAGNSLWVADGSDMQLKQWRTDTRQLVSSFRLNLLKEPPTDVRALKEYQHKLYLFSSDALFIFDRLGAYEQTMPLVDWLSYTFAGNELLLLTEGELLRISLYTGESETIPLPAEGSYTDLLFIDKGYYFFSATGVEAYLLLP